jgi:hypothetical protein
MLPRSNLDVSEVKPRCFQGRTLMMIPRSNLDVLEVKLQLLFRGQSSTISATIATTFRHLRPQQRTSISGGIVDQHHQYYNIPLSTRSSELPQARSSLINATTTATVHLHSTDNDLASTDSLGRALGLWVWTAGDPVVLRSPPLSVDQMVLFPNVFEACNNVVVAEGKSGQIIN